MIFLFVDELIKIATRAILDLLRAKQKLPVTDPPKPETVARDNEIMDAWEDISKKKILGVFNNL